MSTHHALVYRGDDEFHSCVSDFVRDGLAAGDQVLVVAPKPKLDRLRREVVDADDADDAVELWDSAPACARQPGILQLTADFVHERPGRTRLVTEQDLAARSELEVAAYLCQESAANAVYADLPITVLCSYDSSTLTRELLDACRQTHDGLLDDGRLVDNQHYVEPTDFLRSRCAPPEPPASAASLVCWDVDGLAEARRLVAAAADAAGLGDRARLDLVIAVNEVLTNALTHAHPPARLDVYRDGTALACGVRDQGPGFEDPGVGWVAPPWDLTAGRGLLLARQLCDSVEISSGEDGTHVRLMMLPGA